MPGRSLKALVIALSLAANIALIALLAARPDVAPLAVRDVLGRFGATARATKPVVPPKRTPRSTRPNLWSRVYHDNPATFVARLRSAGFPAHVIRGLVTWEVTARFDARLRALRDPEPGTPFWEIKSPYYGMGDQRLEEINQLYRDRARTMRDLFVDAFFESTDVTEAQRRQFGNLSRSKIDVVQRIEDDYNEMNSAVKAASGGVMLPEDHRKLEFLAREKQADLAAVLSPEEFADYAVRSSPITNHIRARLAGFDANPSEFLALFQAHKTFNERVGSRTDALLDFDVRREAQTQYLAELRTRLGEVRYADFIRETSSEFQQVIRIAESHRLPPETARQVYDARDQLARESNRIYDDHGLSTEGKRMALQQLTQSYRVQVQGLLGPAATTSYLKIANSWLAHVEGGAAVSFARANSISVVTDQGTRGFTGGPDYRRLPPRRR